MNRLEGNGSKRLIRLFTGQSFIIARERDKYFVSTETEKHDFTEIDYETYKECIDSPLVDNIIKL